MISISKKLEDAMWGDQAILRYLDLARHSFENGERSALLSVVLLCARFQAVIPDWAVDALLKAEADLESEAARDPNEVFGWKNVRKGARGKQWRQSELASKVLGYLQQHRLSGGGLNADIDLQLVADEIGISRRDVECIYKQSGQFIKDLPRGNVIGGVFVFGYGKISIPRRNGRPILNDQCPTSLDTKHEKSVSD